MPYNNTPITPTAEITGTVSLPLARVKKIIHADEDIANCSNNAAFAITIATEQFLQYLVEQTHNVVKSERKQRRNIQYRDVAGAVSRVDNLEFLTDVVPKTMTYKEYKAKKAKEEANGKTNGQTKLTNGTKSTNGVNGLAHTSTLSVLPASAAAPASLGPQADEMDVDRDELAQGHEGNAT
ncbi:hypothetical protein AAFC00_001884 [Neodothiora populina]|uniref:Transcription factor CBF/NF-Y/archaeal histone domain-containing protein n=1 Tax=Neodothiora populina TaxID=2781224 RepID=A0ABR3PQH3_9PEZI